MNAALSIDQCIVRPSGTVVSVAAYREHLASLEPDQAIEFFLKTLKANGLHEKVDLGIVMVGKEWTVVELVSPGCWRLPLGSEDKAGWTSTDLPDLLTTTFVFFLEQNQ